jgi:hypothetical protein
MSWSCFLTRLAQSGALVELPIKNYLDYINVQKEFARFTEKTPPDLFLVLLLINISIKVL